LLIALKMQNLQNLFSK